MSDLICPICKEPIHNVVEHVQSEAHEKALKEMHKPEMTAEENQISS